MIKKVKTYIVLTVLFIIMPWVFHAEGYGPGAGLDAVYGLNGGSGIQTEREFLIRRDNGKGQDGIISETVTLPMLEPIKILRFDAEKATGTCI